MTNTSLRELFAKVKSLALASPESDTPETLAFRGPERAPCIAEIDRERDYDHVLTSTKGR